MTWAIPDWWSATLLALAILRSFQLLANDTILNRPRDAVTRRLGDRFDEWVACPWCAGAWLTVVWWLFWLWQTKWTLIVATVFAISAIVGLLGRLLPD